MAIGTYAPDPTFTGFDANGDPLSSGKLYTYVAGTSTAASTFSEVTLTSANANPIILDSAGRATIFLTPGASYKFILKDSSDVTIWTRDNIAAIPTSSSNQDVTGVAGEALSAGQIAYLSDGSGSKAAGQWFKADNTNPYSSTLPRIGNVIAAIASGSSGTLREGGQGTGFSSLTVGTTYYIGTSGAVTSTPPSNNRRIVGVADSTSTIILGEPGQPPIDVGVCEGRLTLTTATPVTTADVTAATTIYFTPYKGNRVSLYDGSNWSMRTFAELSIAVPASTSQMYDVWLYDNSGTLTLELLAWTNDTTRATALTTQDGIYVKTGATTRRYLGSCRTTGVSGQTEDSLAKRFIWNYTQRLPRLMRVIEATDSWTYTTATLRQMNGSTANQLAVVIGVAEVPVDIEVVAILGNTNVNVSCVSVIGEDSTSTAAAGQLRKPGSSQVANVLIHLGAYLFKYPAAGYHFYAALEESAATGTTTWYGDNGSADGVQAGIHGMVQG